MNDQATVLLVEDERDLADLYSMWVSEEYDTRTAYNGEDAGGLMDGVDAVLLDRRLPDMSGDKFLESIRDEGYGCPVAMVSAVEPDFDILDMGFDDYLVKPVSKDDLLDLVAELLTVESTAVEMQEYFSLMSKKEALESQKTMADLQQESEYGLVVNAIEEFRDNAVSLAEDVLSEPRDRDDEDREAVFRGTLESWRERKQALGEDDPLHQAAEENVRKYEELLGNGDGDATSELEFLKTVASSFVADGIWLDSRILEALNYVFYDNYDDTFIIDSEPLTEDTELSSGEKYEVSEAVRERANEELGP